MQSTNNDEKNLTEQDDKADVATQRTRRELALIIIGLVGVIALVAVFQNGAMPVLDKFLPLATLAAGFFFGQQAAKL